VFEFPCTLYQTGFVRVLLGFTVYFFFVLNFMGLAPARVEVDFFATLLVLELHARLPIGEWFSSFARPQPSFRLAGRMIPFLLSSNHLTFKACSYSLSSLISSFDVWILPFTVPLPSLQCSLLSSCSARLLFVPPFPRRKPPPFPKNP